MPLPHTFMPGPEQMIPIGTYYRLEPIDGEVGSHVIKNPIYLPVTDTVSWSFNHTYNEADNLSKTIIDSVAQKGGMLGEQVAKVAQRKIGGSVHVSSCAVYVDSAPPTINVRTKLFSPDGRGNILALVELFRQDTHGALGGSSVKEHLAQLGGTISAAVGGDPLTGAGAGRSIGDAAQRGLETIQNVDRSIPGGKSIKSGVIDHPEWWKIQVITFGKSGKTVLATMDDMLCKGINVTFFAPFYDSEPSLIELDMAFQHGFRGLRESMRFGA